MQCLAEVNHELQQGCAGAWPGVTGGNSPRGRGEVREHGVCNGQQVIVAQGVHIHLGEAIQEGLGQALAASPLAEGVLGPKHAEALGTLETPAIGEEVSDKNMCEPAHLESV